MVSDHKAQGHERYARYGIGAGAAIGALTGVLVAGPNFYSWAPSQSSLVVMGSGVCGAVLGRLAITLILAFTSGGTPRIEPPDDTEPISSGLTSSEDSEVREHVATAEAE